MPETNGMDDQELRRYFAGRLPDRLAEVERARDDARDAGWTGDPLRTFHRLAHSLAGAGATFGYPEVSDLARGLERLLKAALGEGAPLREDEVDGLLARLREIAAA
jgi:HPt (histidine-containing phosphotransfer) domain-containing protein